MARVGGGQGHSPLGWGTAIPWPVSQGKPTRTERHSLPLSGTSLSLWGSCHRLSFILTGKVKGQVWRYLRLAAGTSPDYTVHPFIALAIEEWVQRRTLTPVPKPSFSLGAPAGTSVLELPRALSLAFSRGPTDHPATRFELSSSWVWFALLCLGSGKALQERGSSGFLLGRSVFVASRGGCLSTPASGSPENPLHALYDRVTTG